LQTLAVLSVGFGLPMAARYNTDAAKARLRGKKTKNKKNHEFDACIQRQLKRSSACRI
jgi:hypothetical protein